MYVKVVFIHNASWLIHYLLLVTSSLFCFIYIEKVKINVFRESVFRYTTSCCIFFFSWFLNSLNRKEQSWKHKSTFFCRSFVCVILLAIASLKNFFRKTRPKHVNEKNGFKKDDILIFLDILYWIEFYYYYVQRYLSQSWDFGISGFCCESRHQPDVKGLTAISFPVYLTR